MNTRRPRKGDSWVDTPPPRFLPSLEGSESTLHTRLDPFTSTPLDDLDDTQIRKKRFEGKSNRMCRMSIARSITRISKVDLRKNVDLPQSSGTRDSGTTEFESGSDQGVDQCCH